MTSDRFPARQGLYDPRYEHDACGVGFLCNIRGEKSNELLRQGLEVLRRLAHRGAVGADPLTGDGAGILLQIPHEFFAAAARQRGIDLPAPGGYGTGLVFLPTDPAERRFCKQQFASALRGEEHQLLGWRPVPVDDSSIGATARKTAPAFEQVFIARGGSGDQAAFERRLYLIRKKIENVVRESRLAQKSSFYVTNLSSRTFIYKGLLMPDQVGRFFPDLQDERVATALCIVHSRYSTNTFPAWDLAQPFRTLAHNGEINTLRGNKNWMKARQRSLESALFGPDVRQLKPVITPGGSDSASLDNAYELLTMAGRSMPHALMMLIPGAWEHDDLMDPKLREFYQFHATFMEPWDGPAAIAFTDGERIGAVLDRNGLRPARYLVTTDGFVVLASEVGVLDIEPTRILRSGRLEPGRIFFIDTELGRIIEDGEIKEQMAAARPYGEWLRDNLVCLDDLPSPAAGRAPKRGKRAAAPAPDPAAREQDILTLLKAFGYTREDLKTILKPMAETGQEPVGAMGNDTPHAVLSSRPQLLYSYFKQLFAQVTNPPIDPIREELVMSLDSYVGTQKNILDLSPVHCRKLWVKKPVLTLAELEKIRDIGTGGLSARTLPITFLAGKEEDFAESIKRLCRAAEHAIYEGFAFVILSDRGVDGRHAPLPALLAVGAVHQYLVRWGLRSRIGIILESGEPREVHHFALLFGYGADLVCPCLAYDAVAHLAAAGDLEHPPAEAIERYRQAVHKGIQKILSRMGISTLSSYRGAQIFEALGLGADVIERCFTGTPSRIGGASLAVLKQETLLRHREAWPERREFTTPHLATGGVYQWKRDGEFHLWNPASIAALQDAARGGDWGRYREFARLINDQHGHPTTLRGLLRLKPGAAVPLDEVEPEEAIVRRFATGAMSFGSISRGAHETLALAMNSIGGRSNTGEGGEDPARFAPLPDGRSVRSAIKQVASGRFGVTTNYLVNADELQIKIAQGAKPGEGGQLPGHKVSAIIARTRYTTAGVTLISPPPHHDIYSIEDLAQLIFDLKNVNPAARISVKLVSEVGVGTVAAGVAKGHADMILISGGDGGTGASPLSSIRHAGLPWELGLAETHQTLVLNDLRGRVRLQADGQMRTGRDVAVAALLGAEEYGFCTAALVVMGCVMLRHCNLNNCSVGVATQDETLERRFRGKAEHVVTYMRFVARELREIMASLGVRTMDGMIGRTDLLEADPSVIPWKAAGVDLSTILHRPRVPGTVSTRCTRQQEHSLDAVLDRSTIIPLARPALDAGTPVRLSLPIRNHDRAVGAMLSGEICRRHGEAALPDDTVRCVFHGMAGQSFGAFLAGGVTFELEGMANDYVGKGMSGGRIIIYPERAAAYRPEENVIIGNTTLYGATSGEAFIGGVAGERFCIRNSGANAVVEGVGDHGCEYMTGGRVVVLGLTGRNFAAGMSGGIAYVRDVDGGFRGRCNLEMVALEEPGDDDVAAIRRLLHDHQRHTGSPLAARVIKDFQRERACFVKVMPVEYKRVLALAAGGAAEEGD